jgi:hypothetical protein
MSNRQEPAPTAIAGVLANLACGDETHGYITQNVAWRIFFSEGDYVALTAARLINLDLCPAAKHLDDETRADLREIAASASTPPEHTD